MLETAPSRNAPRSWVVGLLLALVLLAGPGYAAQFQLGVLVQAGFAATGPGFWEFGAGNTSGAPVSTNDLTPYWQNGVDRRVEIEYRKATNNLQVRMYQDGTNTSPFSQVNFNPTGGASIVPTATWTLSAASFFVTATNGTFLPTSITLSGLALSPISGALNILQPIQQTTLTAARGFFGATTTVTQSQDIVFQGDSTGSWRLTGNLNLQGFFGFGPFGATGNDLAFGFGATAAGAIVPEVSTFALVGLGMIAMGLIRRRKRLNR